MKVFELMLAVRQGQKHQRSRRRKLLSPSLLGCGVGLLLLVGLSLLAIPASVSEQGRAAVGRGGVVLPPLCGTPGAPPGGWHSLTDHSAFRAGRSASSGYRANDARSH